MHVNRLSTYCPRERTKNLNRSFPHIHSFRPNFSIDDKHTQPRNFLARLSILSFDLDIVDVSLYALLATFHRSAYRSALIP